MILWPAILTRLSLAAFFGAAIGLERERKDWAAGLRTHMMVCVGSALIMMVSAYGFSDALGPKNIVLDPSRVAAQVISGIGFIGAGTILFLRKGIVRGLTTASGLWTVAAIGLATGGGMYFAALVTTILAIIILWVLQPVEKKFSDRFKQKSLRIVTSSKTKSAEIINGIFQSPLLEVSDFILEKDENQFIVLFRFKNLPVAELTTIINDFQSDSSIEEITWSA
jgi:putative Mg2+ transporter-C (MgtC) family protein